MAPSSHFAAGVIAVVVVVVLVVVVVVVLVLRVGTSRVPYLCIKCLEL